MGFWGNTAQQPQKPKKFINISADQVNSNQQAIPVKYLAGRTYVAGDYISPCYNPITEAIKQKTGKSDSSISGYKYFADFAMIFCMGGRAPVDAIYTIIIDSDIRWTGAVSRNPSGSHPNKEVITVDPLGTLHLYWGTESQPVDNVLLTPRETEVGNANPLDQTTWPPNTGDIEAGDPNPYSGHYDQHPAYRGQCYGVFIKWKLGRDRTAVPNIQLELKRGCPAPWVSGGIAPSDNSGVNPVAVLYDWLTDPRFGMGLPDANLNLTSFADTYNTLEGLGARISPLITSQDDFRQVIAQLLEYFDGWIRINGAKLEVGLWSHGAVISSATLTDDDLLGEPELEPQGWGPTVNEVTVVYKDRHHHYNDYTQVYRDPNNFRITGSPRPETLSRPWITDATVAKNYARTTGAIMAMPFTQGTLTVKREWLTKNSMLPGKIFEYDSGFYDLSFLLRLQEIEYGADSAAQATLSVEWERSKWPSLYIPPPFQGPGGFVIGPRGIYRSRITEVPYLLADHKFVTQIVPLAVRGDVTTQSYRVWASFDGGAVYQLVPDDASTSSFPAYGTLNSGGITTGNSGWVQFFLYGVGLDSVISKTAAQQADDTLLCFIDAEVMSIGTVTPLGGGLYYATVLIGRLGTASVGHEAATAMFFIDRARLTLIDNAGFIPGATVLFKLQPFTEDVDYDFDAIVPISYTISGFGDIAPPVFSPSADSFTTTLTIAMTSPPAGFSAHYTADGTSVTSSAALWTGSVTISVTTTLRARFISQSGRQSAETAATYTLVGDSTPVCGSPTWTFSGSLTYTSGNITLTATTGGSTIRYNKNGAGYVTYSSPVFLDCTSSGDSINFYAFLSGYHDSPVTFVNNGAGSGGGPAGGATCAAPAWTFSGTLNQTSGNITLSAVTTGSTIYYQKNYGTITAYSAPVFLDCTGTGDHVEFWATKSGLAESAHLSVDNTSAAACAAPWFTYTGTVGHGVIIVTLHNVTTGATMVYSKNYGPATTYTAPVNVNLNGTLEFWAVKSGLADSQHTFLSNEIGGP
jgi:hypothetical protein